ncbi:MAG: biotin-dependent carboxyltransferase family protein [bacterium]
MNGLLEILDTGPAVTIQDQGRPGYARFGLSAGGAMDAYALAEGATLLGNRNYDAALEMAGYGGKFRAVNQSFWIALTGAPMQSYIDGKPVEWRTSLLLNPGQTLKIGATLNTTCKGTYGYLHVAGGIQVEPEIVAMGTHLRAGIGGIDGKVLTTGAQLSVGSTLNLRSKDTPHQAMTLPAPAYLKRRAIRVLWGPQAERFKESTRQRFLDEEFTLSHRRDRMAMRLQLGPDQPAFEALLTGLSDPIQDGDIQMTGDGVPAILMREHQPTGGYPRIATIISADHAAIAQLPTGEPFRFELITLDQAVEELRRWRNQMKSLAHAVQPVIRSPEEIDNLLDYNLIDGVISAGDPTT